jgi:C1A family cysteine protease
MGTTEGTYNVEQCKPAENNLAEQDLVSCGYNGVTMLGCDGGFAEVALGWVRTNGICTESCFSYRAADVSCSNKCSGPKLWRLTSVSHAGSSIDAVKAYLICHGPVAVSSVNWRHAITLAAWDDNSQICQNHYGKLGCWLIKNSWGGGTFTSYGVYHVGGYGYIPYSGHSYSDIINSRTNWLPVAPTGIKAP